MAKAFHAGNEKYPGGFRHAGGPKVCQRQPGAALGCASRRLRLRPAQVSGGGTRRVRADPRVPPPGYFTSSPAMVLGASAVR
jgi:hypothetical protein